MLVLLAYGEGENVHGKGEKYALYLITVPISIETMLSSFYYLYKVKILCLVAFSTSTFSCQITNNLNED